MKKYIAYLLFEDGDTAEFTFDADKISFENGYIIGKLRDKTTIILKEKYVYCIQEKQT